MIQRVQNKMDRIKGDTFVDIYLIGSISSLNIRLDQADKTSLNLIQRNIGIKLPSVQKAIEKKKLTLCWISNDEYLLLSEKKKMMGCLISFKSK